MDKQTPSATPGWYADPHMAGTQRYWDGEVWTDHVTAAPAPAPASSGPSVGKIGLGVAAGIALVVVVLGGISAMESSNDDLECSIQEANGERC